MNQVISKEFAVQDINTRAHEVVAHRVKSDLATLLKQTDIAGEFVYYGSFCNGFSTGDSDLDITLLTDRGEDTDAAAALRKIATLAPSYNFIHITRIFQANVPILKFSDASGVEIDISVNNRLGIRNSKLLETYCKLDPRIPQLGRLVKTWAKRYELVGTIDGYLNSYAYTLLVIYFLQVGCVPPLAPSLQEAGSEGEYTQHLVKDARGATWSTNFQSDLRQLSFVTQNGEERLEMLLLNFFHFYVNVFDWANDAICVRVGNWKIHKANLLACPKDLEQWCIEDPFNLKHNLANNCTQSAKRRIFAEMQTAMQLLQHNAEYQIATVLNPVLFPSRENAYFLLLRATEDIDPKLMMEQFEEDDLQNIFYPHITRDAKPKYRNIYLEFRTSAARRKARAKTETFIGDHRLQLHDSSANAWQDALVSQQHTVYSMAAFIRQHQERDSEQARRLNPEALPFFPHADTATRSLTEPPSAAEAQYKPSAAETQYKPSAAETPYNPSAAETQYKPSAAETQYKPSAAETQYRTWKASGDKWEDDDGNPQAPVKVKLSAATSASPIRLSSVQPAVSSMAGLWNNSYSELYRDTVQQKTATLRLQQLKLAEQHSKAMSLELEGFQDLVDVICDSWTLVNEDALPMLPQFHSFLLSRNVTLQALGITQTRRLLTQVPAAAAMVITANMVPDLLTLAMECKLPSDLRREAVWAVAILCQRDECPEITQILANAVVIADIVQLFINVLANRLDLAREDAMRALGVIAQASASNRDECLRLGVVPLVLQYVRWNAPLGVLRAALFAISRLCAGKPAPRFDLVLPCFRVLAKLAYHEDEEVVRYTRDALLGPLAVMLSGSKDQIQEVLSCQLIAPLVELMRDGEEVSVRKNACWALYNAINNGSDEQVQEIVMKYNVVEPFCELLEADDWEMVCKALEVIGNILKVGSRMRVEERDHYANLVRDSGGVEKLEALMDSGNSQVCTKALRVLKFFFPSHMPFHDTVENTAPRTTARACPANDALRLTKVGSSGTATMTSVSHHCLGSASSETGTKETASVSSRSSWATVQEEDRPLSRVAEEEEEEESDVSPVFSLASSYSIGRQTMASAHVALADTTLEETESANVGLDPSPTTTTDKSSRDETTTESDKFRAADTSHHARASNLRDAQRSQTANTGDLDNIVGKLRAALDGASQSSYLSATDSSDSSEDECDQLSITNDGNESSAKPRGSALIQPSMLANHGSGQCKPCAFFWHKADRCRRGDACKFCHICGPEQLKEKRRRKKKLKRLKVELRARMERIGQTARSESTAPAPGNAKDAKSPRSSTLSTVSPVRFPSASTH